MSTTDTTFATIEDASDSTDVVDAELVEDEASTPGTDLAVVEDEAPTAKRTRKSRAQKNSEKNGQAEARDVPEAKPVEERSSFSPSKAKAHTEKLRKNVETSVDLFVEAYEGRIWLAFGDTYSRGAQGWAEYLDAELGDTRPRLPQNRRRELVADMKTRAKMSQPSIAAVLGVDPKTVSNDLKALREEGQDVSGETVGSDGVSYSGGPRGRKPRKPKEFLERVEDAIDDVWKSLGNLQDLRAEDEWNEEAGRISARYRGQLHKLSEEFGALRDALQETEEFAEGEESAAG